MRLIDADELSAWLNERLRRCNKGSIVEACLCTVLDMVNSMPAVSTPPNDPLTLEELREMADEIADDFISYVICGVQNAAPYCANMRPECCERPNWCTGYSKECKGFFPKAYRRKPEEGPKNDI